MRTGISFLTSRAVPIVRPSPVVRKNSISPHFQPMSHCYIPLERRFPEVWFVKTSRTGKSLPPRGVLAH